MKQKSGIYKIINKINGKSYFGQAMDLTKRWIRHKHNLKYNKHENSHLQNSFNKYGKDAFTFQIHLYCPIDQLDREEQIVLDICKSAPELFYNMSYDVQHPQRGIKRSKETKLKISGSVKIAMQRPEVRRKFIENNPPVNGKNNPRYDHTIYHFYNEKLNIHENITRYDLYTKYKLSPPHFSCVISGKRKSAYGWVLL